MKHDLICRAGGHARCRPNGLTGAEQPVKLAHQLSQNQHAFSLRKARSNAGVRSLDRKEYRRPVSEHPHFQAGNAQV